MFGICPCTKGFERGENQGDVQSYKTAIAVFRRWHAYRRTAFLFAQGQRRFQCGNDLHDSCHAPVLSLGHVRKKRSAT